jgi:hypothetical protein
MVSIQQAVDPASIERADRLARPETEPHGAAATRGRVERESCVGG